MMNVIFDMETSDPDDVLTLCWLIGNPQVNLTGVTVTPGTQEQIALVRQVFFQVNGHWVTPPIGAFDNSRVDGCVSDFHYRIMNMVLEPFDVMLFIPDTRKADDTGANVLRDVIKKYPDVTLLTGAPLKNLHRLLREHPDVTLKHWVAQGGFAGDSLVVPENRLTKFAGRETCPTFNFNGDPEGALLALSTDKIQKRTLVSKNVCHGISYDLNFHEEFRPHKDKNSAMKVIYKIMASYLKRHPKGKMLHDPLAACVMLNPEICTFEEVEVYRAKGEWGSRRAYNTNTKISVAVDPVKFKETFLLQK